MIEQLSDAKDQSRWSETVRAIRRATLSASTVLMLVAYACFLITLAFDQAIFDQTVGSGLMTLGIPVGIGVILFVLSLTSIYRQELVDALPVTAQGAPSDVPPPGSSSDQ